MFLLLPWKHCPKNLPERIGKGTRGDGHPIRPHQTLFKGSGRGLLRPQVPSGRRAPAARRGLQGLMGGNHQIFLEQKQQFFLLHHPFFIQVKLMAFKKEKFSFEAEENHFMKLQQLSGKHSFQTKDFQRIVEKMIDRMYVQTKGKELK